MSFRGKLEGGARVYMIGRTPGHGELVVTADVHWWQSVSDRLPVTVLPPN